MKILVCVKVVKGEINPFDESALECALQLSDDVTVISMGPKSCAEVLKPSFPLSCICTDLFEPVIFVTKFSTFCAGMQTKPYFSFEFLCNLK